MPTFDIEKSLSIDGLIVGTDEAGRGPWVGPVVAAAVCFPNLDTTDFLKQSLNDSKKLSAKKRELLFDEIHKSGALIGIGQASAEEIDNINILQASFLAMQRAIEQLEEKANSNIDFVLIDGNRLPKWKWPSKDIIKGDAKSLSISAASIIAKVTRDRLLCCLAEEYPQYGWDKNAGYGTAQHIEALKTFGVTPHHRKSYAPIAKILNEKI